MANSIAELVQYYPEWLDKAYAYRSVTEDLTQNTASVGAIPLGNKVIKYPKIALSQRTGYQRFGSGNTNSVGVVQTAWETATLDFERYSQLPIDKLDNEQGGGVALAHTAREQVRTIAIPETDTWRLSKLASYTNVTFGNRIVETLTSANIVTRMNAIMKFFRNQNIEDSRGRLYISATNMGVLASSTELTKFITQNDFGKNGKDISFEFYKFMGYDLIVVPDNRLYTDCNLVANPKADGCHPTATSYLINILAIDKEAPVVRRVLDFAQVYDSTKGGTYIAGFIGYALVTLEVGCCFVPENHIGGIFASVSETSAVGVASGVLVSALAGTAANTTIINAVLPNPNNIAYDTIYVQAAAYNIGDDIAGTKVTLGTQFAPAQANMHIALGLGGKVVATAAVTLPLGA